MNALQRKEIAKKTDYELNEDIERYQKMFNTTGRQLQTIKASINKKLQALIDEKQTRLLLLRR